MSKKITIGEAKNISQKFDYDMVLIIGINNDKSGHITTYGKNKTFCALAGFLSKNIFGEWIFNHVFGLLSKVDEKLLKTILDKNLKQNLKDDTKETEFLK